MCQDISHVHSVNHDKIFPALVLVQYLTQHHDPVMGYASVGRDLQKVLIGCAIVCPDTQLVQPQHDTHHWASKVKPQRVFCSGPTVINSTWVKCVALPCHHSFFQWVLQASLTVQNLQQWCASMLDKMTFIEAHCFSCPSADQAPCFLSKSYS